MKHLIFTILLVGILPDMLYPCSCLPPNPPSVEYEISDAVFLGTVISMSPYSADDTYNLVTLSVAKSWKGVPGDTISILTRWDVAACGFPFETDSTYLVYATDWLWSLVFTSYCSRTIDSIHASEDLLYLESISSIPTSSDNENAGRVALSSKFSPFERTIIVTYAIPGPADIEISIYSITGQLIQTLYKGLSRSGVSELSLDISRFSSGVYIATLESEYGNSLTKLSIVR